MCSFFGVIVVAAIAVVGGVVAFAAGKRSKK